MAVEDHSLTFIIIPHVETNRLSGSLLRLLLDKRWRTVVIGLRNATINEGSHDLAIQRFKYPVEVSTGEC